MTIEADRILTEAWEEQAPKIPHNEEAERSVLGACLIDPDAAARLERLVHVDDFYREDHREIAQAIVDLTRKATPVDFVTVVDELERKGSDVEPYYLTEVINSTPTALYIDYYARIVTRTAVNRGAILFAGEVAKIGFQDLSEEEAYQKINDLRTKYLSPRTLGGVAPIWLSESVRKSWDRLEENQRRSASGEVVNFWPWRSFNENLGQPFRGVIQQFIGDDGTGKTSLLECLSDYLTAYKGYKGLWISLDMTEEMMEYRRDQRWSSIPLDNLRSGNLSDEELSRKMATSDQLDRIGHLLAYYFVPGADVDQVCELIRHMRETERIDFVVLDNLNNLIANPSPRQQAARLDETRRSADNIARLAAVVGEHGEKGAPDENGIWPFFINQVTKSGKDVVSLDDLSKNDVYGSSSQTNISRYFFNLWRPVASSDEYGRRSDGSVGVIARKGQESRYLWVKATKVTAGRTFAQRFLTEFEFARMSEVEQEEQDVDEYDEDF